MKDYNHKKITGIARVADYLGKHAAGRGDTINEAYLQGIAEGLALVELLISDDVHLMTSWVHIFAAQRVHSAGLDASVVSVPPVDRRTLLNPH
ncbi:hypothetical protein [Microvirga sp. BSC39]|uniref:hypothetical protein n=1 Tax=Microvirga sp. BSC39 TaxID=1549810 RepID=UPI0004E8F8F9|nr:hypothetical protein [Microvirga sp. BSC39]KFG69483.1 hypothetical protein JH26_10245 [Microvirga sp. BSC39]